MLWKSLLSSWDVVALGAWPLAARTRTNTNEEQRPELLNKARCVVLCVYVGGVSCSDVVFSF
jgi:hypothetical protein